MLLSLIVGCSVVSHHSELYNVFYPPEDLYEPLASSAITFEQTGKILSTEFKAKYPGNHHIRIYIENPVPDPWSFMTYLQETLKAKVIFRIEDEVIYERIASNEFCYFIEGPEKHGFELVRYKVPDNVPRNRTINVQVILLKVDKQFHARYGKTFAAIGKGSDI